MVNQSSSGTTEALAEFLKWAMQNGPWQGGDLDGGGIQDKAESLGLIDAVIYDPALHGENDNDVCKGEPWFVLSPGVLAAISPTPQIAGDVRDAIPLTDHDEIGRKVVGLPWSIQSAIVTIAAHCTVIKDKCPAGDVSDLAGCISQDLLELADALSGDAAQQPAKPSNDDDRPLPTYGQIPWKQLGRDVLDAIYATRRDYDFGTGYPGHQLLPPLNFNSLARIVDKYRYYGASSVPSTSSKTPIIEPINSVGLRGANKQAHADHASMLPSTPDRSAT